MRLFSEERKNRTDQVLLTAPISITAMVFGKFLAATQVYLLALSVTLAYAFVISLYIIPNWISIIGNFIALFLMGEAMIAIGMFISSLTENQVIAAVGGFVTALILMLTDIYNSIITQPLAQKILNIISFYNRYEGFSIGFFELSNIFYFFSVCGLFLFLTIRSFEKRRWS